MLGSSESATASNVYTYNLTGGTLYANGISMTNTYGHELLQLQRRHVGHD